MELFRSVVVMALWKSLVLEFMVFSLLFVGLELMGLGSLLVFVVWLCMGSGLGLWLGTGIRTGMGSRLGSVMGLGSVSSMETDYSFRLITPA